MPNYRRPFQPGGTFFFTVVTHDRQPIFRSELARLILRSAIEQTRKDRPFDFLAMVLLPEHLHALWTLPESDADFSIRWAAIKARFTRQYLAIGGTERAITSDWAAHRGRGVWQQRFFDHLIRDEEDFAHHLDYLHFNPVKHGHSMCPHAWPHSTFAKWVRRGVYESTWCCCCDGPRKAPDFDWAVSIEME
jgi:putative transposase